MVQTFKKLLKFLHFKYTEEDTPIMTCTGCKKLVYYNDGSAKCDFGEAFAKACISNKFAFRES